jgi:hypothetical protein
VFELVQEFGETPIHAFTHASAEYSVVYAEPLLTPRGQSQVHVYCGIDVVVEYVYEFE